MIGYAVFRALQVELVSSLSSAGITTATLDSFVNQNDSILAEGLTDRHREPFVEHLETFEIDIDRLDAEVVGEALGATIKAERHRRAFEGVK